MKRLTLTLIVLFLGLASSYGQTTPQKQLKTTDSEQPVIATMRSQQAAHQAASRHAALPVALLQKHKALRNADWPSVGVSRPASKAGQVSKAAKAEAVNPPFICKFDYAKELEEKWSVADADGDKKTWSYRTAEFRNTFDGGEESGFVSAGYNADAETADYLITNSPVRMPAGKAYVAFHHASEGRGYVERLRVYYSTKPDARLADMKMIGELLDTTIDWKFSTMSFELPSAGDYYFCFLHCSKADQYNLYLDNVEIGAGDFVGTPDLRIARVDLPLSSCGLGTAETIGARIWNTGTAAMTKWSLSYSVNGGAAVTEEFTQTIAAGEIKTVDFAQKADLSAEGTAYTVTLTGTVVESDGRAEAATDNNGGEGQVTHFSPVETLPFVVNTENEEDLANLGYEPSAWIYDEEYGELNAVLPEPLVTRCVALEAEKTYRFSLNYLGGALIWGMFLQPENFVVVYGPAGTPLTEWDTLRSYEDVYTYEAVTYDEIWFAPEAAGNYSFAIVPSSEEDATNGTLFISNLTVEAVLEHDVKMSGIRTTLARRMPAHHAVAPRFETEVVNRGLSDEDGVKVTVKQGTAAVGESPETSVKSADTGRFAFVGQMAKPAVGSEVTLTFEAGMRQTDGNLENNRRDWKFTATEDLYAYDLDITAYYDGIGMANYEFGQVFTLAEADTLTEVQVGWYDVSPYYDEAYPVGLRIYAVNDGNEVGACLLSYDFDRQLTGGMQSVVIPARVLPSGRYFVALHQYSSSANIAMGFDDQPEGLFYVSVKGVILPETAYGYAALRAKFGHAENVVVKDIEMLSMDKPKIKGVFAANETIEVSYRNNGHEEAEVEFKCRIGDRELEPKKVMVSGYGMGTVSFEADLSAVGTYDIEVEAVASADENAGNNVIGRQVECLAADPYVMDFELCEDFAIEGLLPWTTIDMDGTNTYGFGNTTWPNANQPQGFIAFNPTPVGLEDLMAPYAGERLGCAFAAIEGTNDDWLISPKLLMPAEGAQMKFYAKSLYISERESYTERYEVYASTMGNDPESFQKLGATRRAPHEWTEDVVDLSEYAGKEVYLAIRCVSEDQFVLLVDEIRVAGGLGAEKRADLSACVWAYPNPVSGLWTVTANGPAIERVELCDMMGAVVYRSAGRLSADTWRLNMDGFKPGLYVARVYTSAGVQMIKVTVR